MEAGLAHPVIWRIVSGAGLLVTVYFSSFSIRTVLAAVGTARRKQSLRLLLSIGIPLLIVCLAQIWNVIHVGEFWRVLLLLAALFVVGCYGFVRFLFSPAA